MPGARGRRTEGFYFVVVDGVPQYCQWQELKDYLRDSAKVRPGHTNVVKVNEDGTRVGFCPLPNKTEANRAFEYLVTEGWRGLDVRVSLVWKSDLNSDEIERRRGPEQSRRRRTPNTGTLPPFPSYIPRTARISQTSTICENSSTAILCPQVYSSSSMLISEAHGLPPYLSHASPDGFHGSRMIANPITSDYHTQAMIGSHRYNNSLSASSEYTSSEQTTVSTSKSQEQGYTEGVDCQSIRVVRLPHNTKREELSMLLKRYGRLADLHVSYNQGRNCFADATFESEYEALHAVQELNGTQFGGLPMEVFRYRRRTTRSSSSGDLETRDAIKQTSSGVTTSRLGPLVVNGARGPSYHRRNGDDDSESLEGTSSADEGSSWVPPLKKTHKFQTIRA